MSQPACCATFNSVFRKRIDSLWWCHEGFRYPNFPLALQVSQFLFGDGFAVAGGDQWRVRRRAVNPALHKAYLNTMIDRVFAPSALHLSEKLQVREARPFMQTSNFLLEALFHTMIDSLCTLRVYVHPALHNSEKPQT